MVFFDGSAANLVLLGGPILTSVYVPCLLKCSQRPQYRDKAPHIANRSGECVFNMGVLLLQTSVLSRVQGTLKNQDKLAYYNVVDNTFEKGQDTEDH